MRVPLFLTAVFVGLTGCGGGDEQNAAGEAMSQQDVAAAADAAVRPQPGQYRITTQLLDLSMPAMPGANSDQLRSMMEASLSQERLTCLSAQDAERGYEEMLRQSQDGRCEFQRFSAVGGRLDAAMTCRGEGGQATMTMTGTANSTASDVTMSMRSTVPQMGEMAMQLRVRSERIGDCPA
ncbi:DUF3617 domain-containing protein [Porphyrobacter sp. GA68]|uniref:DUF3617 domain-containing protein n=1 Tax=Porphyrobacter sp. GA68 TaxID=2883480 RepID=UPI001D17ED55|nr:DUF3617 domain-containing protein [Porphyrobacter sp. GA68]